MKRLKRVMNNVSIWMRGMRKSSLNKGLMKRIFLHIIMICIMFKQSRSYIKTMIPIVIPKFMIVKVFMSKDHKENL